jgi:hypothetical protein
MSEIADRELLNAVQNKLDVKGNTFAFAIKAMTRQYMPEGTTSDDPRKIPQSKRAAFLERLRSL